MSLPNNHPGQITLFTFPESVYGRRTAHYLNLRSLPYTQIRVPPNLPRHLLSAKLGINYRRIPILAIGRDVYIDTRMILRKLERFFPEGRLGAAGEEKNGFAAGVEALLEAFVIDGGPFWRTAGCIPTSTPLVRDEVWMRDRYEGSGGKFTREYLERERAFSLSQVRLYLGMLEGMLGDGRQWILGGRELGMAEIHVGWWVDWAAGLAELEDDASDALTEREFPRVFAWLRRFKDAVDRAAEGNSGAGMLEEGEQAEERVVSSILASDFTEQSEIGVETDVLGLRRGQRVSVAPADFGFAHKDEGVLIGLSRDEVVIETEVPGSGNGKLRLHYPRVNFKIMSVAQTEQ